MPSLRLNSPRWAKLDAYGGASAAEVPNLLRRFIKAPSDESFEDLRIQLTGDGDIAAPPAFFAALPHIVRVLGRIPLRQREEILAHLGWAAALGSFETVPKDLRTAYKQGLSRLREEAVRALSMTRSANNKRYLLAAIAAASDEPEVALAAVHLDDALLCPRCGASCDCPNCGLRFDGLKLFGERTQLDEDLQRKRLLRDAVVVWP